VGLVGLGMFLSSLTLSQLLSTQILMLVALPSFLLSGFTWPLFAMPVWIQSLARILPLTHYLAVVRKTVTNGASWSPNLGEVQWLFGFAVVGVGLQLLSVWWRLRAQPVTEEETGEDYAAAARTEYAPHQA
ncbi:MAG: ABC transporter permease, partial [Armatimonadetes bacterium]|nr:ABC transporter permease [Armatimonadota bacterium]